MLFVFWICLSKLLIRHCSLWDDNSTHHFINLPVFGQWQVQISHPVLSWKGFFNMLTMWYPCFSLVSPLLLFGLLSVPLYHCSERFVFSSEALLDFRLDVIIVVGVYFNGLFGITALTQKLINLIITSTILSILSCWKTFQSVARKQPLSSSLYFSCQTLTVYETSLLLFRVDRKVGITWMVWRFKFDGGGLILAAYASLMLP